MRRGWLDTIRQDGRDAVRGPCRRPLRFVAVAALLALAVGITTGMLTSVYALAVAARAMPPPVSRSAAMDRAIT